MRKDLEQQLIDLEQKMPGIEEKLKDSSCGYDGIYWYTTTLDFAYSETESYQVCVAKKKSGEHGHSVMPTSKQSIELYFRPKNDKKSEIKRFVVPKHYEGDPEVKELRISILADELELPLKGIFSGTKYKYNLTEEYQKTSS